MKFVDVADVIPDEVQQGRSSLCLQERGVTRAHNSLIVGSLLALGSAGSCHVITGSFVVMGIRKYAFQVSVNIGGAAYHHSREIKSVSLQEFRSSQDETDSII